MAGAWMVVVMSSAPSAASDGDLAVRGTCADCGALDIGSGFGGAVQLAPDPAVVGAQVEVCGGAGGDAHLHRPVRGRHGAGAGRELADLHGAVGVVEGEVAGGPVEDDVSR